MIVFLLATLFGFGVSQDVKNAAPKPPHEYRADIAAFEIARMHCHELPAPEPENMGPAR